MNSLHDSISDKSLLQLVSKTAFTPKDLKNVVSFLKTYDVLDRAIEFRLNNFTFSKNWEQFSMQTNAQNSTN